MPKYLLSTYGGDAAAREPRSETEAEDAWRQLREVEADMKADGAWFFSGRLHDPDTATVVRTSGGRAVTTDGPFVEAAEHIAGFYIVDAPDLDAALEWGRRVTACIGAPIEVWPFVDAAD